MDRKFWWFTAAVGTICVAIVLYYVKSINNEKHTQPSLVPAASSTPDAAPAIRNPIPQPSPAGEPSPLPALNASDSVVSESLAQILGKKTVTEYLVPENIIHRAVATIDSLPRKGAPAQARPLAPTAGRFTASGTEDEPVLSAENYQRYTPLVQVIAAANTERLADMYVRFYPLFQSTYEGMGYAGGYFNDRMVEVIDHLLATPDVKGPIKLTHPSVYYQFADPALEQLSAGQKTLLRMGGENSAIVKGKLREFRSKIANRHR